MTDSTNPRVMADNIKELSCVQITQAAELEALKTYSTDEVNTGVKWYNGDVLYSKVIHADALANEKTTTEYGTAISGISIKKFEAYFTDTNGNIFYNPYLRLDITSTPALGLAQGITARALANGKISVITASDRSGYSMDAIIYYTKPAPTPDVSPASDTRSLEEEPEREVEEPINEELKKEEK